MLDIGFTSFLISYIQSACFLFKISAILLISFINSLKTTFRMRIFSPGTTCMVSLQSVLNLDLRRLDLHVIVNKCTGSSQIEQNYGDG